MTLSANPASRFASAGVLLFLAAQVALQAQTHRQRQDYSLPHRLGRFIQWLVGYLGRASIQHVAFEIWLPFRLVPSGR